jgi:hypothetical protein
MAGAEQIQERTISHTGSELGSSNVTLSQNQVSPQLETKIIEFEGPRQFEEIRYYGPQHWTKMILRSLVEIADAPAQTTQSISHDLIPIAGEEALDDQPFPTIVGYNVTDDSELDIVSVDYAADEVELSAAPTADDNLKFYPVLSRGTVKYQAVNPFGQVEGALDTWGVPVYRWADFDQDQRGTEINLQGSLEWGETEVLRMVLDSEQQVTWTDDHYPDGAYVSTLEQRVEIEL